MDHIISYRRAGANKDSMKKCLKNLCVKYTDWGLIACDGYVEIEIVCIFNCVLLNFIVIIHFIGYNFVYN